MGKIFSHANNREFRRFLRKNSTKAEQVLWNELRGKKLGVKFRRQHGVGRYILDFYCSSKKLSIEIDGGIHKISENKEYDQERTDFVRNLGIKELRFSNEEVQNNLSHVINAIRDELI